MTTYFLSDSSPGAQATQEVMALFGFYPVEESAADLIISHQIKDGVIPEITTVLIGYKNGERRQESCQESGEIVGSRKGVERAIRLCVYRLLTNWTGQDPSPWGILRGVRPTKIVRLLASAGHNFAEIQAILEQRFHVHSSEAALVTEIAFRQQPILQENNSRKISLYLGIPFCPSRCFYCSFPGSVLPESAKVKTFLQALQADMDDAAEVNDRYQLEVDTIYLGGGTPTSLAASDLGALLTRISDRFMQKDTREFTVEAGRPDSLDAEKIAAIACTKVTRVSVNPQTMQEKTLKRIGRNHTVQAIIDIFMKFRQTSCLINMDLIAGLPGESVADMENTLEQIMALAPDNLTVHTLAVKKGALLKERLDADEQAVRSALTDDTVVKAQVAKAAQTAAKLSMVPYYLYRQKYMAAQLHNVGYAKENAFCRYNIQMMEQQQTIIGIGPGAATKAVERETFRLNSFYHPKDVRTYEQSLPMYLTKRRQLLDDLYEGRLFAGSKGEPSC
ncbi:MAG: coproporphyrinogen dehydrogenase HemZ [Sporomusaceae bacterium]|nr:coproporphyrinogen dehydrogenase HemZ [Sporomusaceae bacterium]